MEKVTLKDKTFKKFISYEKISAAIDEVANKINADFEGCTDVPVLLCVLNGSIMFMGELMKRLTFNCQVISIKLTSYEGTSTTGRVKQALGLTSSIEGRRVIVIEDIVDSGNTIVELSEILKENGAAESYMCPPAQRHCLGREAAHGVPRDVRRRVPRRHGRRGDQGAAL